MWEVMESIGITLRIALPATLLAVVAGGGLAWLLAGRRSTPAAVVEMLICLPLVLPPTIMGFYLLTLLGREGLVGGPMHRWLDTGIIFTPMAAVVAAWAAATPIVFKTLKAAMETVDADLLGAARLDGASEWRLLLSIRLPLAGKALLAGTLLALLRAMGEFGATLMVAGNIPGKTQTLSLAIWGAVMTGEHVKAHVLAVTLCVLCLGVVLTVRSLDWGLGGRSLSG